MRTYFKGKLPAIFAVIFILCFYNNPSQAQQENLQLFDFWQYYSDAENALYKSLSQRAFEQLEVRKEQVSKLNSKADWQNRRSTVKNKLQKVVGPFPEKTPLNPQITGRVQGNGFTVEHVVYESRPDFYVSASMFIPDNLDGQTPAIVYFSGHTSLAYRSTTYQHVILNLVKKGFIILAVDPVGQGERLQYYDPEREESVIGGPSTEHSYVGAQCFIAGNTVANYFIWDGIRSIDYLMTREEVDPERIGVTGRSGGGTQTAYIGAFDERVQAAAIENYITSYEKLFKSRAPQDAEQNFFQSIEEGLDQGDLLTARMPKPTQIIATTRDIFSIEGTRNVYQEAMAGFRAMGSAENLEMVVDDHVHGSTEKNREAMYAFFQMHLDLPGNARDQDVELFPLKKLQVTETGQVLNALNSKRVFDLNKEAANQLQENLENQRDNNLEDHLTSLPQKVKDISGYESPSPSKEIVFSGRFQRDGYAIEKYLLVQNELYAIPLIAMVPEGNKKEELILYLHPDGKSAEAGQGEQMERLVQQGHVVVAPDVRGIGELGPGYLQGDSYISGTSYNKWFAGILTGKSIVALQMEDITKTLNFAKEQFEVDRGNVYGVSSGILTPVLLHSATISKEFSRLLLQLPLISYHSLVANIFYENAWIPESVPGSLKAYDLPDLAAAFAPNKLWMVNTENHLGNPVDQEQLENEYDFVKKEYNQRGMESNFVMSSIDMGDSWERVLDRWLESEK